MKKNSLLLLLVLCFTACGKDSNTTTIEGTIEGLTNDTVYLYGMGGLYERTDTILANKGKFSHTLQVDTTGVAMLLYNHQIIYPIFLEKGDRLKVTGKKDGTLTVEGNDTNKEFAAYQQEITGLGQPSEKVLEEKAEAYILAHPSSFVSLYLLNTYFVQKESPDFDKIKKLTDQMTGLLQDAPYIQDLRKEIEKPGSAGVSKMLPYFGVNNAKGKLITRRDSFNDKYLLIQFWASWNDSCRADFDSLRVLNRRYLAEVKKPVKKTDATTVEKKGFALLGISFDLEKEAWQEAIKKDTLNWEQVSNLQGIDSELSRQFGLLELPTYLLIAPDGRILARENELKKITDTLPRYPLQKKR